MTISHEEYENGSIRKQYLNKCVYKLIEVLQEAEDGGYLNFILEDNKKEIEDLKNKLGLKNYEMDK